MSRAWFSYTGPFGGEYNSTKYRIINLKPTCLEGTSTICAIYGIHRPETYGSSPAPFSENLITYISALKATNNAQPAGLGQKKYVYSYPAP